MNSRRVFALVAGVLAVLAAGCGRPVPGTATASGSGGAAAQAALTPAQLWMLGSIDGSADGAATPTELADVVSVACGAGFVTAATADGSVYVWGEGFSGVLNDPEPGKLVVPAPRKVTGLPAVTQVAAGENTAYALASDGTVWAWGSADDGALGTGRTAADSHVPARVPGVDRITAIAAASTTAYALRPDGTIVSWGGVALGRERTTGTEVPQPVVGLTGVVRIAAGDQVGMAVTADGQAWIWGTAQYGALGDGVLGQQDDGAEPRPVPGLSGVVDVAAGSRRAFAVTGDGALWGWGNGYAGVIGDGNSDDHAVPTPRRMADGIAAVDSGYGTVFGIGRDGTINAWGAVNTIAGPGEPRIGGPARITAVADPQLVAGCGLAGSYSAFAVAGS